MSETLDPTRPDPVTCERDGCDEPVTAFVEYDSPDGPYDEYVCDDHEDDLTDAHDRREIHIGYRLNLGVQR